MVKSMVKDLAQQNIPKAILDEITAKSEKTKKKTPDQLSKIVAKAMLKVNGVEHKSHIVVHGDGKSVIFDVPSKTLKLAEAVHGLEAAGVDIAGVLHEALLGVIAKIKPVKVEESEDEDED